MQVGEKVKFEGEVAEVIMLDMGVNHFSEGKFTHATRDGVLLRVPSMLPACLAREVEGVLTATIADWRKVK